MAEFVLENTSWEWWIRPKTVYCDGRMWLGGLDDAGHVRVDVIGPDGTCERVDVATIGVGLTGADDHNSAAILAVPGKVPIIFWEGHNASLFTSYRRGTDDAANGRRAFLAAQSQTWAGISGSQGVTYPHVFNVNDEVHVLTRVKTASNAGRFYGYMHSSDWAATWDILPTAILDGTASISQLYPAMAHVTGDILRIGYGTDPDGEGTHDIYYCQLNLTTGDIATAEAPGTSLGNARTATGLPVLRTECSVVRTCPVGLRSNYYDTSRGTVPECCWVEFDEADTQGTATYYVGSFVSGAWVVNPVCSAGEEFGQSVGGQGGYMGGCHFTNEDPDAIDLLVSRNHGGGDWTIERWHSDDHGATWGMPVVIASDTVPLVRPFQIEGLGDFKAVYERITRYGNDIDDLNGYNDWKASLIVTTE